jgi:hypothetical protein
MPLKVKSLEQRLLRYRPLAHHRRFSRTCGNTDSAAGDYFKPAFLNTLGRIAAAVAPYAEMQFSPGECLASS